MAEIVKPKDIAKILENIPENQLANAAEELGVKPEQLTKFVNKPTGKAFEKIAETLGEGIEGAQKFVDKFLQRGAAEVPPPPSKPLALPPAAVEPAPALPAVVTPPGPLSPRMQSLGSKAQKGVIDVEPIMAKPALPPGQAEAPKMSQAPTQQAMEAATAPKPPQMSTAKRAAAAGLVGLGAGFSKEANAPTTIKAAEVDKVQDLSPAINKAVDQGAVTPEQKSVLENQAQQLEIAAQSLEQKLTTDYEKKKARVELMQLAETVMSGLVTAIGANALLNRGSPYAVDFSKGPKTDWAGEFDRLQKDYSTQMGAIMQKYKLEAAEKRAQAREEAIESRFVRGQELEREKLEAQKAKETEAAGRKTQEKEEKTQSDIRASIGVIQDETAAPGRILTEKKNLLRLGNTKLGEPAIQKLLTQATNSVEGGRSLARQGKLLVKDFFNMDIGLNAEEQQAVTKKFAELLEQELDKQGRPAAPAPATAPSKVQVEVNGQLGEIPADQVAAFLKKYPNAKVK